MMIGPKKVPEVSPGASLQMSPRSVLGYGDRSYILFEDLARYLDLPIVLRMHYRRCMSLGSWMTSSKRVRESRLSTKCRVELNTGNATRYEHFAFLYNIVNRTAEIRCYTDHFSSLRKIKNYL